MLARCDSDGIFHPGKMQPLHDEKRMFTQVISGDVVRLRPVWSTCKYTKPVPNYWRAHKRETSHAVAIPQPRVPAVYKTDQRPHRGPFLSKTHSNIRATCWPREAADAHQSSRYDQPVQHRRVWSGLNLPRSRPSPLVSILLPSPHGGQPLNRNLPNTWQGFSDTEGQATEAAGKEGANSPDMGRWLQQRERWFHPHRERQKQT